MPEKGSLTVCLEARLRAIMCSHGFVSSLPRVGCSKAKCDDLGSCNCNEAWEFVRLVKKEAKEERAAKIVIRGRRVPTRQRCEYGMSSRTATGLEAVPNKGYVGFLG